MVMEIVFTLDYSLLQTDGEVVKRLKFQKGLASQIVYK